MALQLKSILTSTLGAGLLAAAALTASTAAASAHERYARCDRDGDRCAVMRCDHDDCYRARIDRPYYDRDRYEHRRGHWACDRDGDRCHWVPARRYW